MHTAGVVLDFYDDVSGSLVKQARSAFEAPEDLAKTLDNFHFLSPEEREVLRDDAYALVMQDEGTVFRKFACVDEGNTVLSTLYFMQNWEKLPTEAVKTAAANLMEHLCEFSLPVPNMLKMAAKTGMSRSRDSAKQPQQSEEADWNQRTNLVSIQGGGDSGRVIPAASSMKTAEKKDKKKGEKVDFLEGFHKLNPEAKPKEKKAGPVDVSGQSAELFVKRASAERTALGGRFPLDAMADVQRAVSYFEENYKTIDPVEAHIFAVKTASRADELGIEISETMSRYGSTTYAEDVDAHMANRLAACAPEFTEVYEELREKRAHMEPIEFASLLSEADEMSGLKWVWGGDVADPFYATFGKTASAWSWQSRTGDFISEDDLKTLARNGRPLIHKHFSSDMTNAFIKDPIAIFDSLPDDSKIILARLAADNGGGVTN